MKTCSYYIRTIILGTLAFFGACTSTRIAQQKSSISTELSEAARSCSQTIKYYSDKIKISFGAQEVSVKSEIVINPSQKTITVTSEPPNQQRVSFITIIESIDCELGADLTNGYSIYTGYIQQLDGTTSKEVIKLEAKDGSLTISNADPDKEGGLTICISNWEIINE